MNFDMIVVGRTPLGSAVRAAAVTVLIGMFWEVLLTGFWQRAIVTLVTAVVVVVAAHWISRRDNAWRAPGDGFGG